MVVMVQVIDFFIGEGGIDGMCVWCLVEEMLVIECIVIGGEGL